LYPPRSAKFARLNLIPKYYELKALKAHKARPKGALGKAWKRFLIQWDNYDSEE
jgi:hypothetical protein